MKSPESIYDDRPLADTFNQSEFLRDFRQLAASSTRGCIVLERPDLLIELAQRHGARDTTARGTALDELAALTPRPSQYNPGQEIPEKSWVYRFAKKHWFNDFGTYSQHFREENWQGAKSDNAKSLTGTKS